MLFVHDNRYFPLTRSLADLKIQCLYLLKTYRNFFNIREIFHEIFAGRNLMKLYNTSSKAFIALLTALVFIDFIAIRHQIREHQAFQQVLGPI